MKSLRQLLPIAIAMVMVVSSFLAGSGANAAGVENTGGVKGYTEYVSWRWIDNPATYGPEVAFIQYSGATTLQMGIYGSGYMNTMYPMSYGEWRGAGFSSAPKWFKVRAACTTDWSGRIAWD